MTSADESERGVGLSPEALEEMRKYGVTRAPADHFLVGAYRYTNLADAIAQAKRQQERNERR